MIGKLAGRIDYRGADHVLLDVRGVGYIVHVSDRTLAGLPPVGQVAALYTDLLVREDLLQLFGFATVLEKEWHRLLMTVQGIGAKASMAILGTLGADGVARAVATGDVTAFRAAPGVGPKIAQRVVLELRAKAPALMVLGGASGAVAAAAPAPDDVLDADVLAAARPPAVTPRAAAAAAAGARASAPAGGVSAVAEALSALTNLGYAPGDAAGAVAQAAGAEPQGDTPLLIRAALKLLAPKV